MGDVQDAGIPKTRVRPTEIRKRTAAKTVPSITIVVSKRMITAYARAG